MAEDSDLEKTEAATPRRLEKAREEGQVARSRELNTFMLLAGGVAGLWFMGGELYRTLTGLIRSGMWFDLRITKDTGVMVEQAANSAWNALLVLMPIFALLVILAILSSVSLGGLLFSAKALEPKFSRLNPLSGVKRMFSAQTLVELLKTLLKAAVIGGIAAWVIWSYRVDMLALMHASPSAAMANGMRLVALCSGLIVAALILLVLIDAPWQLYSHLKKLRMSRQDVKQEHKESEGDPHVKGRIRQQQRAMARQRMMSSVPQADVIVTNPTHYAVALKYDDGSGGAPRVLAKGTGLVAARIRMVAEEHKVPLLSAPPLARALHEHVELGQEIPVELYKAVAEVLAWVFQLRSWNEGAGFEPIMPENLPVPPEFDPLAANA
ncbi:MAG: flagellar biosynthesis protein FlhB [Pusillimonas sp.]